ncbi:coiled-coil domain-containing protein 82 [Thamnophis elegans]|uniref:coiled-coil domain-containing protein 82 n=1 Tax=Thamnophis elegans TaxID=35005 RepID=UPI0013786EDF|nr:coiled-coil domain-containing protein 82 [Thamnophis elegans]
MESNPASHGEGGSNADFQKGSSNASSEDLEAENISFKKKRRWRVVIYDSDESSDSNIPRKVIAKDRRVISEDDLSVGEESPASPENKAANRKQGRQQKIPEFFDQQSGKAGKVNQHDEDDDDKITTASSSSSSSSSEKNPKSTSKEDGKEEETSLLRKSHGEAIAKGRSVISEDPEKKAANRKRERQRKLQELSDRRSGKAGKVNHHDEGSADDPLIQHDGHSPLPQEEIGVISNEDGDEGGRGGGEEGEGGDEEEEEEEEEEVEERDHVVSNLLKKHVPFVSESDRYAHFQRVVKAFLINAIDDTFLSSLYEKRREKKYAREMLNSLYHFDERFIQPYLESVVSQHFCKEPYKNQLDNYSDICIISHDIERRICQACKLMRDCRFVVTFSGKQYCPRTLKVDDFLKDNTQRFEVGIVCQRRTKVYHELKHYKYKLYQKCCRAIQEQYLQDENGDENLQDEPVKDLVKRVFGKLEEEGWIHTQYSELERCHNEVENFHTFLKNFKENICSFEQYY